MPREDLRSTDADRGRSTADVVIDHIPSAHESGAREAGAHDGLAAVLLAAGGGRRFGSPGEKLLAPLGGRPIVAWALEAVLAAGIEPVVVVEGAVRLEQLVGELTQGSAAVVCNRSWASGQGSSLRTGLDWCAERSVQAAVVGLGDQPLVGAMAWRRVAETTVAPVVTATFAGRRRPPVRLDRSVWPLLAQSGDEGARALMRQHPDLVAEVPCAGDPVDIDTPDDLAAAEEAVASRPG